MDLDKAKELIKSLPEHKSHLEFISALLTIPVLITVFMLNLNNLRGSKSSPSPTPSPSIIQSKPIASPSVHSIVPKTSHVTSVETTDTPLPTVNADQCVKGIGQIDIAFPQEGQTVSDNPLCVDINYTAGNYCSVVWAYKINNSPLSDYTNNSVCLYNLPSGSNTFILQVKSLVSADTKTITRNFTYQPNVTPTLSLTPTSNASSSGVIH